LREPHGNVGFFLLRPHELPEPRTREHQHFVTPFFLAGDGDLLDVIALLHEETHVTPFVRALPTSEALEVDERRNLSGLRNHL
jgi:hypothetical protein